MNHRMFEQVATLRDQQLVTRSLHEQFVARVVPPLADVPAVLSMLQQQLGALLVRVRVRLQDLHAGRAPWLSPGAVGERGANASSDEPVYWLSPCRLP
jgi:hypothetical protein